MMESVILWAENSDLAELIRTDDVLFPLIETIHVIMLCLVFGTILITDLRLIGVASTNRPADKVMLPILPVTWIGFLVAAITGVLMFISNATHYLANSFFVIKISLILLAGVNMAVFHFVTGKNILSWRNQPQPPVVIRLTGGASLALWVGIIACGRWIGFTMQAIP
jgi:hypothetical protein